ncbi:hypothetical protein GN244_ATG19653 [Phytophthora infestans]|uniref:WRKY19-like zinc finger domain-containing protein n=1 Tax=Phytophthora infestans TaxID=4787 RepID=A0A833WIN9_PHYIN|nr:hypothetical protein GN244_ATG19653 [Phytophthora infestans]
MTNKTQLDFILNPVVEATRLAPLLPSLLPKTTCISPTWSAASPSSVSGWNGEQAVLATLLRIKHPGAAPQAQLRAIARSGGHRDLQEGPCASTGTSSEGESSDVDSPKNGLTSHKKKTRLCKEKGCTSLAVSRRSCVRHGGGSRCTFEGCTNGAKLRNRCFQHGGSTICLAAGCNSKAKRYGYCWSHGGGRICSQEGCVKVAAQGGSCWAHGGGNRCKLEGCSKRSYQKYGYYCKGHSAHNV